MLTRAQALANEGITHGSSHYAADFSPFTVLHDSWTLLIVLYPGTRHLKTISRQSVGEARSYR